MINIPRNDPAPDSLWDADKSERRMRRFLSGLQTPRTDWSYLAMIYYGSIVVGHAAALSPADPRILDGLHCMAEGGAAAFEMAQPDQTGSKVFDVLGYQVVIPAYIADNSADPVKWSNAVFAAVALREMEVARRLCADATVRVVLNVPGLELGPGFVAYVRLIQAWVMRQDPRPWIASLGDMKRSEKGWWGLIAQPTQELLAVACMGRFSLFEGLLGEAIFKHKRFYEKGLERGNHEQWVALGPLAVACWVKQKIDKPNWQPAITSDYLLPIVLEQQ